MWNLSFLRSYPLKDKDKQVKEYPIRTLLKWIIKLLTFGKFLLYTNLMSEEDSKLIAKIMWILSYTMNQEAKYLSTLKLEDLRGYLDGSWRHHSLIIKRWKKIKIIIKHCIEISNYSLWS